MGDLELIRIKDLPTEDAPQATDFLAIDNGSTRKVLPAKLMDAARPFASQGEAEAGTVSDKSMSPLTTKQAIEAIGDERFASINITNQLMPSGGDTGQVLRKDSSTNFDAEWGDFTGVAFGPSLVNVGSTDTVDLGAEGISGASIEAFADGAPLRYGVDFNVVGSDLVPLSPWFGMSGTLTVWGKYATGEAPVSGGGGDEYDYSVAVEEFAADPTGTVDSSTAFQAAVEALPARGGRIRAQGGKYRINTAPVVGTKTVYWDLGVNTEFVGTAVAFHGWPYLRSNFGHRAAGPYLFSQTTDNTPDGGGLSVFTVDVLQSSADVAQQLAAIYGGAVSQSPNVGANIWGANFLVASEATHKGVAQGIEVDVNVSSTGAVTKGISISGGGTQNADVGLEITRLSNRWNRGVHILDCSDGILLDAETSGRGLVIRPRGQDVTALVGAAATIGQLVNGVDTLVLQRRTDTGPSGLLLRCLTKAGAGVYQVDVFGNTLSSGINVASGFRATGSTPATSAGEVAIGASFTPGAWTPAGDPDGYWTISVSGSSVRIPYYNAP